MVSIVLSYTLRAGGFAFLITAFYLFYATYKNQEKQAKLCNACLIFYLSALYHITCIRYGIDIERMLHHSVRQIQWIPLIDLIALIEEGFVPALLMIGGNILWFIPLGMFVYRKYPTHKHYPLIIGFLTSFFIEVSQFILVSGVSDIDDLILNTLGCVLGFSVYKAWETRKLSK